MRSSLGFHDRELVDRPSIAIALPFATTVRYRSTVSPPPEILPRPNLRILHLLKINDSQPDLTFSPGLSTFRRSALFSRISLKGLKTKGRAGRGVERRARGEETIAIIRVVMYRPPPRGLVLVAAGHFCFSVLARSPLYVLPVSACVCARIAGKIQPVRHRVAQVRAGPGRSGWLVAERNGGGSDRAGPEPSYSCGQQA